MSEVPRRTTPHPLMDDPNSRIFSMRMLTRAKLRGRTLARRIKEAERNRQLAMWLAERFADWIYAGETWRTKILPRFAGLPKTEQIIGPPIVEVMTVLKHDPAVLQELRFELWDFAEDTTAHAKIAEHGFTEIRYARRVDNSFDTRPVHIKFE